jgi:DNA invertase Pin-like site-specific DNA recombinase
MWRSRVSPVEALIYCRVSKDQRAGRSVAEQERECRRVCDREGWRVADVLTDNDRGASRHSRSRRPAWEDVKHRVASSDIDVLVLWEASRSTRDLAGFVELRDLCRAHSVLLSYSGRTLDLDDARDSFQAGLDALLAEDESERTRARILRSVRAQAEQGRPHGRRLYGYRRVYDDSTGALVGQVPEPSEAKIIKELARRYLAGESTYALAEDLNRRGVALPTGVAWSETRIKRLLTNPAFVALRVHRGEVVGEASWPAILDLDTFEAIAAKYADPSRAKFRGGHDLRHLLSGIARCKLCGAALYVGNDRGRPTYICREGKGHLARSQQALDAYVTVAVLDRLAKVDLDDLSTESPEVAAARAEVVELRERLAAATREYSDGNLTARTLATIERDLLGRIAAAKREGREHVVSPFVRDLAGEGVDERWDALTIEQRREVVRLVVDVTVLPSTRPRGSRGFDDKAVRLDWRA